MSVSQGKILYSCLQKIIFIKLSEFIVTTTAMLLLLFRKIYTTIAVSWDCTESDFGNATPFCFLKREMTVFLHFDVPGHISDMYATSPTFGLFLPFPQLQ